MIEELTGFTERAIVGGNDTEAESRAKIGSCVSIGEERSMSVKSGKVWVAPRRFSSYYVDFD